MEFPNHSPHAQQNNYPPRRSCFRLVFTHQQGRRMRNHYVLSRRMQRGPETPSPLVNPFFLIPYARPVVIGLLFYTCRGRDSSFNDSQPTDDRMAKLGRNSRVGLQSNHRKRVGMDHLIFK
ncbi:hypothetical protein CEXT_214761 [Caerostris extrusa]|uniref:Uncharacterized protein n=1 Tax=Caerostris extrusa TaxID=172846 RepID=A0AAV4YDX3_CAEEX|nr:hypothetical protein CEXT_214761 [Caerostris extrusa]